MAPTTSGTSTTGHTVIPRVYGAPGGAAHRRPRSGREVTSTAKGRWRGDTFPARIKPMRLLVLGGTHHVGRAFVEAALARGDEVTTVTRGVSGTPVDGASARHADRLDPEAMRAALGDDEWDAVVDTWSAAPVAVQTSARLLRGRVPHYTYISSCSVYTWPIAPGSDESAPVVDGEASSADGTDYAAAKRGAELAVLAEFDGDVAIARAGLILGPYEMVGRLPFWLGRIARGGRGRA